MTTGTDVLHARCQNCKDKSCATQVLNRKELDLIFNSRYVTEVKKGTCILIEGAPASHIVYLRSGLVKEYIQKPGRHEQIIQIILPHSYLGLTSIFGNNVNQFSYSAVTDLLLCYIEVEVFTRLIKNNGKFAFEILSSQGRDSLNSFHRFIDQSHKRIYGRIAEILIYFGKVIFSNNKFQVPLTRNEIADMVGTSRESAGRIFSKFRAEGIIEVQGRNIIINDMDRLEKISRYG
jgi:CRP-like cAMP-binding protein